MSIVIIEGIDRVGKTTLACLLSREFNAKILKDKMLEGRALTQEIVSEKMYTTINLLTLWPENDIIIVDRFHLSELVYGQIERGYINKDMRKMDELLSKLDVKLILVEPTDVEWSSKMHGKDLQTHKNFFDITYDWTKVKDKFKCTHENLSDAVEWLKGVL